MATTAIPLKVKEAVAKRDSFQGHPCCILCGRPAPTENPLAFSCAHVVSRAQGGSMDVDNIVTLCPDCHRRYDQTDERQFLRMRIEYYLHDKFMIEYCNFIHDHIDEIIESAACKRDTTDDTTECPYGDDFDCFTCPNEDRCIEKENEQWADEP